MYVRASPMSKFNFYPRPPRGGRRLGCRLRQRQDWISIHALREEGDGICTVLSLILV